MTDIFAGAGPASSATPSAAAPSPLIAPSLRRRMACWLYEGMLLFAVLFVAGWLFSTLSQMRDAMDARRPLLQGFLFIIFGVYFAWFWAKGQTLAMKTWNIRIVDRQGRPLTQLRALLRYALAWIWFLPSMAVAHAFHLGGGETTVLILGWIAIWAVLSRFHPLGQFWHDAWAGTRLVHSLPLSR
ncbi:RDD family protein [Variovorax sp. VNK109]|uniref:RDD family protein n=1 Tax=Variovorax sp. VNK109 TaxID=3400919 RepID=UPI003BFDD4D8